MHDAIIVGGGPVGSQLACRLATMGYRIVVLDRKPDSGVPVCCTGIVSEECVRAYGIPERIIFRHANSALVFAPSGKAVRLNRGSPQAAILDRPAFNAFMAERAGEAGAEFLMGARATRLAFNDDFAEVTYCRDGASEHLAAKVVVVATGFSQELSVKAGLKQADRFAAGAQAEVEARDVEEIEVYLGSRFSPGYFAWLVPTKNGKALAGLLARQAPRPSLARFLCFLQSEGKISSPDASIGVSAVALRPPGRTYSDRLLVVGTAAGQVKPTTGGGIYYGLLCADIAARVLDEGLRKGSLSRRSLSAYQKAWKATLDAEIRTGYWGRKIYERLSDSRLDRIVDIMESSGIIENISKRDEVSFDWHAGSIRHLLTYRALAKLITGR